MNVPSDSAPRQTKMETFSDRQSEARADPFRLPGSNIGLLVKELPLGQLWPHLVDLFGTRPAVRCAAERLTYNALHSQQSRLALAFSNLGIGKGDRVAIWLPNVVEWVVAELACASIGAVVVPVNARFRAEEMLQVVVDSGAKVLLQTDRFLSNDYHARACDVLPELQSEDMRKFEGAPQLRHVITLATDRPPGMLLLRELIQLAREGLTNCDVGLTLADEFLAFWTSGTTGRPTGVVHDGTILSNVWNGTARLEYGPSDRVLVNHPLYYIAGNLWGLLGTLLRGAEIILVPTLSAESVLEEAARVQATVLSGSPSRLSALAEGVNPDLDLALRAGFTGGEGALPEQLRYIRRSLGYETLLQAYGMTELQGFCMTTQKDDPEHLDGAIIGTPLPGFKVRIADPRTGVSVADGQVGELLVRGRIPVRLIQDASARGGTSAIDADGWFHTGDLLSREIVDRRFRFHGRIKDLIKVGGENVTAAEVEAALKGHPAIQRVIAIGIPDPVKTERVAAFVEWGAGQHLTEEDMKAWAAQRMAPYKQPSLYFEILKWPLTDSGKVARVLLRELAMAGFAAPNGPDQGVHARRLL